MATTTAPAPVLTVETEVVGSASVLRLRGALTAGSIAALEAQVDQLSCLPCHDVAIDLRGLTALDADGAGIIDCLCYYVIGRGGRPSVVGATGEVARALAAPGLGAWAGTGDRSAGGAP